MAQGQFFDGRTARPHEVTVTVLSDGLQIYGERGANLGTWRLDGLRFESSLDSETEADLMHGDHPDARLTITDPALLHRLRSLAPHIFKTRRPRRSIPQILFQITLVVGILALRFFVIVPRTAGVIAGFIPVEWETEWGKGIRDQMIGKRKVCRNPAGRAALQRLVEKLASTAPATKSRYQFNVTVIEMKIENALATMGGQIVLFSELIDEVDSPDELAGVLAHELAHVVARHPLAGSIEAMAASIFAGQFGSTSSDVGGALVISAYSRKKEAEADRIAAAILRDAGIDTNGLATFFERLKKKSGTGGGALTLFSTHPELGERAAELKGKENNTTTPALTPGEWEALKNICL